MVRTTLEHQGISELPEGNQVLMMPRWQEGNEEIICYPRYLVYSQGEGNGAMQLIMVFYYMPSVHDLD